ncbi:MAG: CubicO group peptidase (beta-lactamase class C family) [Planctomycetota bacterium]|jgi:CubicO group peptidase (beta-lactamase class C family)
MCARRQSTLTRMQRRCLAFSLLLAALSVPVFAQDAGPDPWPTATPESVGCDADKLRHAVGSIRKLIEQDEVCGAVLFVARGCSILLHEALGVRDANGTKPMKKDTLFRMASNTKAVTAAAVLTLVDEGKVGLDDPIHKWFPAWGDGDAKKITVRQLLTHSSGLRINTLFMQPLMKKSKRHPAAPNLVLECARFGKVGPKVEPGTTYSYSNPGYNTLAGLVEVVTGKNFESYCAERFYEPLGMVDTNNHESRADNSRMSVVVRGRTKDQWNVRWSPGDRATLPFVRGSGGLISTATDYARFCCMTLDGGMLGDRRLLSQEFITAATRNQIKHIKGGRYGFGWRIDANGSFSHSGSDGTFVWCDPERDLIGMVLTQTQRAGTLPKARARFRKLVSAACPPVDVVRKAQK